MRGFKIILQQIMLPSTVGRCCICSEVSLCPLQDMFFPCKTASLLGQSVARTRLCVAAQTFESFLHLH